MVVVAVVTVVIILSFLLNFHKIYKFQAAFVCLTKFTFIVFIFTLLVH